MIMSCYSQPTQPFIHRRYAHDVLVRAAIGAPELYIKFLFQTLINMVVAQKKCFIRGIRFSAKYPATPKSGTATFPDLRACGSRSGV